MLVSAIAILAKAPLAGLAKTRLAPLLGPQGAARAQRAFILQTVRMANRAGLGSVTLWCAPDARHRLFRLLGQRCGVPCRPQPAGDLGVRMHAAFVAHFAVTPDQPLLLVGTDCAVLTPAHLQRAATALATHEAVLIPAEDGGYVLIGLRRPVASLFEGVAWSTAAVLEQTRARMRAAAIDCAELPPLWDVDEPADWQRWQALLSAR